MPCLDQKEKIGAFVTPEGPAGGGLCPWRDKPYVDAYPTASVLVYVRTLYAALGV